MLTTESNKVEKSPLFEVQNKFNSEISSGELLDKLTKKVHRVFNSSVKNSKNLKNKTLVFQFDIDESLKMFYSFEKKEFEFYTKSELENRSENNLIFDDLLLINKNFNIIKKSRSKEFKNVFFTSLKSKELRENDLNSLRFFVEKNILNKLIPSVYEFLLELRNKIDNDWIPLVKEVNSGNFPLRLLDEKKVLFYVKLLFSGNVKHTVNFNQKFFSSDSCKRLKDASEKALNELEKSKDLGFKLKTLSNLKSKGFISPMKFFDYFNNTIENNFNNFNYKFNLELSSLGATILNQVLEANFYINNCELCDTPLKDDGTIQIKICSTLKRFKTDRLVRCLKNLELINSIKKDNNDFLYLSLLFYLELESRNVNFKDYPDFKISFWFLMKLFRWTNNNEFELLKDVDIILYKTDVLDVLELLSLKKRKVDLENSADVELYCSIHLDNLYTMKSSGFKLFVPNEFYSNLELFVKMLDSGFTATETGTYELISRKLLKLFQKK